MAELHRGARRYDLHLSGPQVVGIVVGSLVTLGLAFGIGVGFGRRLAIAEAPPKVGPEPVAAPQETPDAGSHESFTYPTELTKSDPPPPPLPKPVPPIAAKPSTATVATPEVEPQPMAAVVDAGTPSVVIGPLHAVPAPPKVEEPPAPAPPPKPAPVAPKPAPKAEEAATDRFTVQFLATTSQGDADKFARRLKEAGYAAQVIAAEVPGKGHLFRVRSGHFPTKEAAETFREQALARHKMAGTVMPSR